MQTPDINFEKKLWKKGITLVAGIDEAGRGAWAGPVAAGAVILPNETSILKNLNGVRDSKQMTAHQRAIWAERIKQIAVCWGVGLASNEEIDQLGILPATKLAMKRAILSLDYVPKHLLIDAVKLRDIEIPQTALIHGDALVLSIAAASVLAKTTRDAILVDLAIDYPGYGFERHKGYGTKMHREQLRLMGPTKIHRFSYEPIKGLSK